MEHTCYLSPRKAAETISQRLGSPCDWGKTEGTLSSFQANKLLNWATM